MHIVYSESSGDKPTGPYWRKLVSELRRRWPEAHDIHLAARGSRNRIKLDPRDILYVQSTGGRYSHCAEIRVGSEVGRDADTFSSACGLHYKRVYYDWDLHSK